MCDYSESVYADGEIDESNIQAAIKKAMSWYEKKSG